MFAGCGPSCAHLRISHLMSGARRSHDCFGPKLHPSTDIDQRSASDASSVDGGSACGFDTTGPHKGTLRGYARLHTIEVGLAGAVCLLVTVRTDDITFGRSALRHVLSPHLLMPSRQSCLICSALDVYTRSGDDAGG